MNIKRRYDRAFKINAAKQYQKSGKSLVQLASDLGIPMTTLATWVKQFNEHGNECFPGSGSLTPCNEELYQLKKELADVRMERDILKKAVAIFSKPKK